MAFTIPTKAARILKQSIADFYIKAEFPNGETEFDDDIESIPMCLFDKFFIDREKGGYYSHIDPVTFDPKSDSLGRNVGRKNLNSVGDHAPAYLINLYLATMNDKYKDFLEYTADCIEEHFKDYDNSPFVQEKFYDD